MAINTRGASAGQRKPQRKPGKNLSYHAGTAPERRTMGITLSMEDHALLHAVAHRRAIKTGGRSSMSGIIAELIDKHRTEFEDEAKS